MKKNVGLGPFGMERKRLPPQARSTAILKKDLFRRKLSILKI
jgi:hypothetical protein